MKKILIYHLTIFVLLVVLLFFISEPILNIFAADIHNVEMWLNLLLFGTLFILVATIISIVFFINRLNKRNSQQTNYVTTNDMNMVNFWQGFADGQPSESIQKHSLPSIAVSVLFPYSPNSTLLKIPVKQFKDYKPKNKAKRTDELTNWIIENKEKGLRIVGFSHAHKQEDAAVFGMKFLEELPDTRVEKHYSSYRLYFGENHIDFPQAVALQYYFFTINFGALRAALKINKNDRRLVILMDRFSGESIGDIKPGTPIPSTPGVKFLSYLENHSKTGISLLAENRSINLDLKFGTLDWWKDELNGDWKKGKSHPHFVLPDWMAAASSAVQFPEEYAASFANEKHGKEIVESLTRLHSGIKSFDVWSMDDKVLQHIVPEEKNWTIPEDARDFIMERARRE